MPAPIPMPAPAAPPGFFAASPMGCGALVVGVEKHGSQLTLTIKSIRSKAQSIRSTDGGSRGVRGRSI